MKTLINLAKQIKEPKFGIIYPNVYTQKVIQNYFESKNNINLDREYMNLQEISNIKRLDKKEKNCLINLLQNRDSEQRVNKIIHLYFLS